MNLKNKNWIGLFGANFFGVFNDNMLKNLVAFVGILWVAKEKSSMVISLASAMLFIPPVLFSPLAGKIAKIYQKENVLKLAKLSEIAIVFLSILGFYLTSLPLLLISIFLLGLAACMYNPAKYALIRDIGGKEGISFGTGTLEMLTFSGVLLGTVVAGILSDYYQLLTIALILISIGIIGFLSSFLLKVKEPIPSTDTSDSINPFVFMYKMFKWCKTIKGLNFVVIGLSFFWLVASLLQMNLYRYCPEVLKMTNTQTGIVMSIAAIGIAVGTYLAGILSRKKVELRLVSIGALLMITSFILIYLLKPNNLLFSILIFFSALSAGFYKIPLAAWIQDNVDGPMLSEVLAYANMMDFIFILLSAAFIAFNLFPTYYFLVLFIISILMILIAFYNIPGMKIIINKK